MVLSYGLGVDSTAILLRWLLEPASRDFALENLVVVTAMTGDEWPETGALAAEHVLPRLRAHAIRFVQVARASPSQRGGIAVLSDTRSPGQLFLSGAYRLSEELLTAGTVPQVGGARLCSQKAKGWPLDVAIERIVGRGQKFRHVLGFEANERRRAARDSCANNLNRTGEYPLIEWGWTRADCVQFIRDVTGVEWWKSACVYCPFALTSEAGRHRTLEQYRHNPRAAAAALLIEHVSVLLNPRQGLAGQLRLRHLLEAAGNERALRLFEDHVGRMQHALYDVRRIFRPSAADPSKVANSSRSVRRLAVGSRAGLRWELARFGRVEEDRVWVRRRTSTLPCVEHLYVVAPNVVLDKAPSHFDSWWASLVRE